MYNSERFQEYDDQPICGHLCLIVLKKLPSGENYEKIIKGLKIELFRVKEMYFLINKLELNSEMFNRITDEIGPDALVEWYNIKKKSKKYRIQA